jgi:hypothetical protein
MGGFGGTDAGNERRFPDDRSCPGLRKSAHLVAAVHKTCEEDTAENMIPYVTSIFPFRYLTF